MNTAALKDLVYRLADDKLIIGHRNSEWTGFGPFLEEDIAFSSMAQDEVGHAQAYYEILTELGEDIPDKIAFMRNGSNKAEDFRCCHFMELPIGDYAFSLVRHYLYEMADMVRLNALQESSYAPLAQLAKKLSREERYHQLHARTFMEQLGRSTEEANRRLQEALNQAYPVAFSMFEPTAHTEALAMDGVQITEDQLLKQWCGIVEPFLQDCNLHIPAAVKFADHFGGRSGHHTEHLQPLLTEMSEVFAIDPEATW